ncbi:protein AATF isoform X1 [Dermacentor andersoni]|uniref:protein AATF isoform X1 n=1 Tax=Dermacentor andersoni TaxID=34620 RepID=UPI003B3A2215
MAIMSLLNNLDDLLNTAPALVDPEDDIHEDTKARLVNKCSADYEDVTVQKPKPGRRPQVILGDRYVGKKVSRKDLDEDGFDTDDDDLQSNEDDGDDMSDLDSSGETDQLENAKNEEREPLASENSDDEDELDDEEGEEHGSEEDTLLDGATSTSNQKSSEAAGMDNFSTVDVAAEVKKGKAVHSQLQIWDSILELRIQLQKLLVLANQFPKHDQYPLFRSAALEQDKKNGNLIGQARSSIEFIMHQLLTLQEQLRDSYPEIRSLFSNTGDKENGTNEIDSENEEIPSDTEAEESSDEAEGEPSNADSAKRKAGEQAPTKKPSKCRKMDVCIASAAEFWKKFEPYRNATIEKWYERTRLLSGKVGRSFASLEQSPVKQIEHILMDEERLLRRTQTRRSSYKILGAGEAANDEQEQKSGMGEPDEEIFDDDDFYHHLLREIIERKTSNIDNPVALSRQWLEIQKLRKKVKRKVDTRASKGRKIRYDIIPKLVNFMAPLDRSTYSEEAKTELFGSLFGQKKYAE